MKRGHIENKNKLKKMARQQNLIFVLQKDISAKLEHYPVQKDQCQKED